MSEFSFRLAPEDVQAIVVALADELERRNGRAEPEGAILTLEELAERLPAGRNWRRWLYDHAPRGDVPGAFKTAGRWYFREAVTLPGLLEERV